MIFACVFESHLLKPMEILYAALSIFLKPMRLSAKTSLEPKKNNQNPLKSMRLSAKIARQTARRRALLATPSPSVKDGRLSRTHSFASPTRTARTKRKRRRNEADLPVTGGCHKGELTPLNLRYIYIYIYIYVKHTYTA